MPKGNIPDRWLPYTACGKIIEGTRIICFKVPLRKEVQQHIPGLKTIWDVPTVIEEIPDLAGVIDLTNTNRYYNPNEFTQANVMYKKILMPGREIPPEQKVIAFMDAVDEFLGKDGVAVQSEPSRRGISTADKVVGVHCTHGLNRTGYMVCRYMIDRLNVPGEDAINRFQEARGFKIERDVYISALLKKNILSNIDGYTRQPKKMNNMQPGEKSQRQTGEKSQRHTGEKSQRHTGEKSQRHTGEKSQRHTGEKSQRHTGEKSQRQTGEKSQRHTGEKSQRQTGEKSSSQPDDAVIAKKRLRKRNRSKNKRNKSKSETKPKKRKIY